MDRGINHMERESCLRLLHIQSVAHFGSYVSTAARSCEPQQFGGSNLPRNRQETSPLPKERETSEESRRSSDSQGFS